MPPTAKTKKPTKAPKAPQPPVTPREIVHPELVVCSKRIDPAKTVITAAMARELLGWEIIPEGAGRDAVPLLIDEERHPIRCTNNDHNRPFDLAAMKALRQDILSKNWRLNCEPIVIGKTGQVLNGQKRLAALVLAAQLWALKPHWQDLWGKDTEPTIQSLIVFGANEDPETVRTIDCTQPRDYADVLFCDETLFRTVKIGSKTTFVRPKDRKTLAKMLMNAIKFLWDRLGSAGKQNAFAPHATNAELDDFRRRHPRLIRCVQHIFEENQRPENTDDAGKKVLGPYPLGRYYSPGYASGLLYLMGSCASGGDGYRTPAVAADGSQVPSEASLDWTHWDRACEFWTCLAGNDAELAPLLQARRPEADGTYDGYYFAQGEGAGSKTEKTAAIILAWKQFLAGGKLTPDGCTPRYTDHATRGWILAECPTTDGIDCGDRKEEAETPEAEEGEEGEGTDPSPEEIEAEKEAIKAARLKVIADRAAARKAAKNKPEPTEGLTEAGKRAAAEQQARAQTQEPDSLKTRKQIEAEQTARAAAADAELAAQGNGEAPADKEEEPATKVGKRVTDRKPRG